MVATNFLAYDIVTAVTVPLVVESISHRCARFACTAFAVLGRAILDVQPGDARRDGDGAGRALLLVLPGVLALLAHALYAPVTVMEGGPVGTALRRARSLARAVLDDGARHHRAPVRAADPRLDRVGRGVLHVEAGRSPAVARVGHSLSSSGKAALFQVLNVFVTPLTSIMTALLYLKMRQACGESLLDAVERFDALQVRGAAGRSAGRAAAGHRPRDRRPLRSDSRGLAAAAGAAASRGSRYERQVLREAAPRSVPRTAVPVRRGR